MKSKEKCYFYDSTVTVWTICILLADLPIDGRRGSLYKLTWTDRDHIGERLQGNCTELAC